MKEKMMEKYKLVIAEKDGVIRYGYFCNGTPLELYCEPKEQTSLIGNIYAARVERVAEGIGGAFLEIGRKEKCYFKFPKERQPVKLSPGHKDKLYGGDIILVQITKDAAKTKLPAADGNISFHGKYFVLTLIDKRFGISKKIRDAAERKRLTAFVSQYKKDDFGIIIRTNAKDAGEEELQKEMESLIAQYKELMRKAAFAEGKTLLYREPPYYITLGKELPEQELDEIVTDSPDIYAELQKYYGGQEGDGRKKLTLYQDVYGLDKLYRLNHYYEEAVQKFVWLKSGGSLVIEPTEAMTVIDVNSGSVTKKKKQAERVYYQMNKEAAEEIARQIRVRNLSGIIVIDFINMQEKKQQEELLKYLEEQCQKDRTTCRVVDITALGLVEMIRSKARKPLYEQIREVKGQ